MTTAASAPSVREVQVMLERAADALAQVDLSVADEDSVLALWRTLEATRRRLDPGEYRLINHAVEQGWPFSHGCASAKVFVAALLRITPAEAAVRVRNAEALGPRRDQYGQPLGAIFPLVAAAVDEGAITARAGGAIVKAIESVPYEVTAVAGVAMEEHIVNYARTVDSVQAARFAADVAYAFDQDGRLADEERAERRRDVTLRRRVDGSGTMTCELTCELAELIQVVLDALAAPQPAKDGVRDPRTVGQRNHDALRDALQLLLQTRDVPSTKGCRTTVVLHADADDFATDPNTDTDTTDSDSDAAAGGMPARQPDRTMTTGHGYRVSMKQAKRWLEPETRIMLVLLSKTKGIEAYSSFARLFNEPARYALHARDGGCTTPGCDTAAAWCEAHHVEEYEKTGHATVAEGGLLCGLNHRTFEKLGWVNIMKDGRPAWIPPSWVDPEQKIQTNTRHQMPDPTLPE